MDVFIEYMVKRKKSILDYVKVLATLVFGLVLIFVVSVVFATIPYITSFILLAVAGVIYGMYHLISSINVEYEYILTNSELDVDRIINAKKRKHLTTVNLRQLEDRGKKSDAGFDRAFNDKGIKKIYACKDIKDSELYYIVYYSDEEKKMLLFNPNEKIMNRIEILNPRRGV